MLLLLVAIIAVGLATLKLVRRVGSTGSPSGLCRPRDCLSSRREMVNYCCRGTDEARHVMARNWNG